MKTAIDLSDLLSKARLSKQDRLRLFAVLTLGIAESLMSGALSAAKVTEFFFHAQNCLFVRKRLRSEMADEIMSRGVQLEDLLEILPKKEAQREYQRELEAIRSLCLRLLNQRQLVA